MYQDNKVFSERKWGDPVRVKASFNSHTKRIDGHIVPELRRFSVDPQLTNYEILRSLLERAFDIHSDFLIQYRLEDPTGQECFIQLLSDWDLEAAFVSASNPYLHLRIDPIPLEQTVDEWDLINISVGEIGTIKTKGMRADPSLQIKFMTKVEKTFNLMQQALNLNSNSGDEFSIGLSTAPLTDAEFTDFRDGIGTLIKVDEFRQRIFHGGLEPSLRRIVWKHLLNVYPEGLNGSERMNYIRRKSDEYGQLKSKWICHYQKKEMSEELKNVASMVMKDVLRTDRQHPFYGGSDDNPNVEELFNVLTTYAMLHPSVGYCQGMSDMASPILFVMASESHAYIAFCALMERLKDNFTTTGAAMTLKFEHLTAALQYYDPEFFAYLERHNASDLLFCYRWLLLEMKREFVFDEALRMLEVTWSSLPVKPRQIDLALYETIPEFRAKPTAQTRLNSLGQRIKETPYAKVCAVRRQGSLAHCGSPGSIPDSPASHAESRSPKAGSRFSFESQQEAIQKAEQPCDDDVFVTNGDESKDKGKSPIPATDSQPTNEDRVAAASESGSFAYQDFEVIASCEEAVEALPRSTQKTDTSENSSHLIHLPAPDVLGCGNPFLIFLCITVLLQHRDLIMNRSLDSNELAMHFDRLVRKHNLERVLSHARTLYFKYLEQFDKYGKSHNGISPKRNVAL